MRRRSFLIGLGGFAGAGALTTGTGAVNFANVERTVSISVADDRDAFLSLTQRGSGERSEVDGNPDTLDFSIPGEDEDEYPTGSSTAPEGVGTDSVYRFAEDAAHDERGLFGVINKGNTPVRIYSTQSTSGSVPSVTIFDVETGDLLTKGSPSASLETGEQLLCGLEVDTHGVAVQNSEYDVSLIINAETPEE